jgi:hypothetical protein
MIGVLMGNKYRFQLCRIDTLLQHPGYDLACGNPGINQYGLMMIPDIVTIAIAAGCYCAQVDHGNILF